MKNADMPAAPCAIPNDPRENAQARAHGVHVPDFNVHTGLTKREMMAMHMMAAMLVGAEDPNVVYCAAIAIKGADQLIFELERTKGESK